MTMCRTMTSIIASVAINDSGFVITWYDYKVGGNYWDTYAQRYDPAGTALGGNSVVKTRSLPSIAMIPAWRPATAAL